MCPQNGHECRKNKRPQLGQKKVVRCVRANNESVLTYILKLIAPGTDIRQGLDNILKAKTGGLIVVGDSKEVMDIVDRRF